MSIKRLEWPRFIFKNDTALYDETDTDHKRYFDIFFEVFVLAMKTFASTCGRCSHDSANKL